MKKLSQTLMAATITEKRKTAGMTQQQLADATGINRAVISRIESEDFMPSLAQLETLGEILGFEVTDLFVNNAAEASSEKHAPMNIAVAGTGYVGLSIATLLSQNNHVTAVDIIQEKVDLINNRKSPMTALILDIAVINSLFFFSTTTPYISALSTLPPVA